LSSGSKRSAKPPELAAWQLTAIDRVAASRLASEVVLGGGSALAAVYLHHRTSEDLDFFLMRELETAELTGLAASLRSRTLKTEVEVVGPRTSILLLKGSKSMGRLDFAFYPYDAVGRRKRWRGLTVESLEDMTVNKVQAVLTRARPRDFVDLYFLLREGPLRDLRSLLDLVRAKFDVGSHAMGLAGRLLLARDIKELPRMIRPVTLPELVAFFEERARGLLQSEPDPPR